MLHPDRTAKWEWKMAATPLIHKPRPSVGRDQQDGRVRWAEDFFGLEALHTERERKLRIKLFDRYFSSFSQWA